MAEKKLNRRELEILKIYSDYSWIKKSYINGDLRLFGSLNLYGVWNAVIYNIYKTICEYKVSKLPPLPTKND